MSIAQEAPHYPAITGVGMYAPEQALSNAELIALTGITSTPEWIEAHTGIEYRHFVKDGQMPSDLAVEAAWQALGVAGIEAGELTSIHLAAGAQDYSSPSVASIVHRKLEAQRRCLSLDVKAACAGFVLGLEAAAARVQTQSNGGKALVVGAEVMSARMDLTDRRSAILFGDGAGAAVVQPVAGANRPYSVMLTEPNLEAIYVPAGGLMQPALGPGDPDARIRMDGPAVKRHALSVMSTATRLVAAEAGLADPADPNAAIDWPEIDLFVPHQANLRLIEAVGEQVGVPGDKCMVTVNRFGNTSSASVPMALATAHQEGRLHRDRPSRVLVTAIGAGMVGGAVLIDVAIGGQAA